VKQHPEQELQGVVQELHPDHGILFSLDGRKIYFHEHSLVDFRFDDLRVGMGVSFAEVSGREGPQASTVRVVDSRSGQRTLEGELPS
jgi:cold shock CspA family protein